VGVSTTMMSRQQLEIREAEAERISKAIVDCISDVVPDGEFILTVSGRVIGVVGVGARRGNSFRTHPFLVWLLPVPATRRLSIIFGSLSKDLQRFLSRVTGRPWPVEGATPHVRITDREIRVWWGSVDESEAVVKIEPILRSDIGV
jgi:hypothetical protein